MSWLLPRQIGASRALDLLWSSRRVSATEALRLGLVDRVVPAGTELDAVAAYARDLRAKSSPRALAEIKAQVYAHLSSDFVTATRDSAQRMEGARSFVERRAPRFQPWSNKS
jgi:enoyl-CoA hydratase/carnithine racemase